MIDKEKAINLLNNIGKEQGGYLYREQKPYKNGFFFKTLQSKNAFSYCILIYENYNEDLVKDIIFKNEEEMKVFIEDHLYPPYFGEWTTELTNKMLKEFPSLSLKKTSWNDGYFNIINSWGDAVACYRPEKEN